MVVLGTKPEYFGAVWVKNEWSRYLALIRNGADKTLVPAYRDMDPYDLPDEFAHLQAQDMGKGYMVSLQKQIEKTIDREAVLGILDRLEPWRNERNQLIHALLSKTVTSSETARKECAHTGQDMARGIDDALVKPFKKNNRLRKQHNIQ